jgi:hypothetical protein
MYCCCCITPLLIAQAPSSGIDDGAESTDEPTAVSNDIDMCACFVMFTHSAYSMY